MKTKTIPFDLETAKKIQAGEIKGRIMSNNAEAHIIDLDMYFQGKKYICTQILGNHGGYLTSLYNTDGTDADFIAGYGLYIELQYFDNESQFKPFDKVLVRCYDGDKWVAALYSNYNAYNSTHVVCGGTRYKDCIPYEGNEDLVGTTKNPKRTNYDLHI